MSNTSSTIPDRIASTFSSLTGIGTTPTWDLSHIPPLTDKVFVVTGGSAGIGFGIVSALAAHHPKKIIFLSSQEAVAQEALSALEAQGTAGCVEWLPCDLNSLKSVEAATKTLKSKLKELGRVDGFVANAGIGIGKYQMSPDGIESHFQINHLSHMYLILSLLPEFKAHADKYKQEVRVVLQASENHRLTTHSATTFSSLDEINTDVGASSLYSRTKLAQLCFMHALIRRLEAGELPSVVCPYTKRSATVVNCTHPGVIGTEQMKQMEEAWGVLGSVLVKTVKATVAGDPMIHGCLPVLYCLTDPNLMRGMERGGPIYGQYVTPPNRVDIKEGTMAGDVDLQERLWSLSEKLLKERLGRIADY